MAGRSAYEVIVKVLADASKATSEFKRAETAADRMAKRTTDSMKLAEINTQKFAKQATIAGGVLIAAGTTMALALSRTVKSAQEAEDAQLKLQNTIKGSAALGPRAMAAFEGQAKSIQRVTVASDDAVMGIQSMLGQMGMTQQQVLTLTPLVVDLSRKMGVGYDTAAKAVGKAVTGATNGLKRMGVVVDATKAKLDPFGATVDALRRSAGGFAQQEGQTFAGQMAILGNQADELKESLGRGVLSVLTKMLPAVNNAAGAFVSLDDATGGTIGSFAAFGTGITIASGTAAAAVGQFQNLKKTYDQLTESSVAFQKVSAATPYVLAAAAGIIAGQKLGEVILHGQEMANQGYKQMFNAKDVQGRVQAWAKAAEGEYRKSLTGFANVGRQIGGALGDVFSPSRDGSSKYMNVIRDLQRQAFSKSFTNMLTIDPEGARSIIDYAKHHREARKAIEENAGGLAKYEKMLRTTVDTNHDGTKSVDEWAAAAQRATAGQQELQNALMQGDSVARQYTSAQLDLARAHNDAGQAQKDYNEALKSGDPAKIRDAQLGLQGALIQVAAAEESVRAAAIKAAEAQLDLKRVAGDNQKYEDEIQHLKDLRDAVNDPALLAGLQDSIDYLNLLHINAGKKLDLNDADMMASLWRLVAAGKVTEKQLRDLLGPWKSGPIDTKATEDSINRLRWTLAMTNEQWRIYWNNGRGPLGPVNPTAGMNGPTDVVIGPAPGRAVGGPVTAGSPYVVGEHGPELFVPNTSGTIVPNGQLAGGGAMGSTVFNINVSSTPLATPAETGAAVVDALTAWQRRNGRLPLTVS